MVAFRGAPGLHRLTPPVLIGLLVLATVLPAVAQSRGFSPDDRLILTDFTRITAVAASRDRVFAVTEDALASYDAAGRRWEGPFAPPRPGALRGVFAALVDPLDGGLWLARPDGYLHFDPGIQLWDEGAVVGLVTAIALDELAPASGLFLRTSTGWYNASRGGPAFPSAAPQKPLSPATVGDAVRSNPAIQATIASLGFAAPMRPARYTSAARAEGFNGLGWYLGTSGAGLVYFPEGAGLPGRLPFGLPSNAVDAVYAGLDGIWAVTERTLTSDPAVTFIGGRLESFQWLTGPRATGLPFAQARRIVGQGSSLWISTESGIVRLTPRTEDVERFDEGRGLPDRRVLDVAQQRGRVVVGTERGIAVWSDSLGFQRLAPEFADAALSVLLMGDTTWVGTRIGLFVAVPEERDLIQPAALSGSLTLQAAILDIAWRGDTLVLLSEHRLLWRDPATGRFAAGPLLGEALGRLHTIVNGSRGLFVAGELGIGFAQLNTPIMRPVVAPGDLPGQVTDIAVDDTYLWIATLRGLVRLRRELAGE